MIYGFDTDQKVDATAALIVYSIYRSRSNRFKVSKDMWGKIERFVKASAKRSINLPLFIEKFKIKMNCDSIDPKWAEAGIKNNIILSSNDGHYIEPAENKEQREFLTAAIAQIDDSKAIKSLYTQTAWIILLVRERLEREKPSEKFIKFDEEDKS